MLQLVSGISSLCLFVNFILVPVLPFPTYLFLHPSLFSLLIHHSVHLYNPTHSLFHSRLNQIKFIDAKGPVGH